MKKLLVLLTAAAMVCAFAASASAASEFSFYGNLRLFTYTSETSSEANSITHSDTNGSGLGVVTGSGVAFNESDRGMNLDLAGHSRFGANIAISDDLSGLIELGAGGSDADVSLRRLYGVYDFGAGKLLIGHDWHPAGVNVGYSSQVGTGDDNSLGNVGITSGRNAQVRLTFGDFGLYFISPDHDQISGIGDGVTASVSAKSGSAVAVDGSEAYEYYDDDVTWPHVAAVYNLKYDNFSFGILGAFQTYEVSDTRGIYEFDEANRTGGSWDVDSHLLKLGVKGEFDAFTFGITYGFGQNIKNMSLSAEGAISASISSTDNSVVNRKILDVSTTAYTIVGGFKVNDMLNLEAGYGKVSNDIDGALKDDETSAYYLQAAITVTDGFVITPEIGKYDYEDDSAGNNQGDKTYFGAKWQINF